MSRLFGQTAPTSVLHPGAASSLGLGIGIAAVQGPVSAFSCVRGRGHATGQVPRRAPGLLKR